MANYLYYSKHCGVDEIYIKEYLNIEKCKRIEDKEEVEIAMKKLMSNIYMFISLCDREMIAKLQEMQCKPNITIFTTDEYVCRQLKSSVAAICLLDETTACLPALWNTQVVKYNNVSALRKLGKKPVDFQITVKPDFTVYGFEFNEENGLMTATFTNYKYTEGIKEFKKEVKQRLKEAKLAIKASKNDTKVTYKNEIKVGKIDMLATAGADIAQYMVENHYLSSEDIQSLPPANTLKVPLELRAFEAGLISGSEVVEIIRNYYNVDAEDYRTLSYYKYERKIISESLSQRGVLECYAPEDIACNEPFIVVSYLDRDQIESDIIKAVNFKRLIYTIPVYIEELLKEHA